MKISTKGRYALRLMLELALDKENQFVSLNDLAQRLNISNKYLEQLIARLNKENYVDSARGKQGGYRLNKKPYQYKIGDILRLMEGNLSPTKCVNEECDRKSICKSYLFWQGLDQVIENYVDSKTLADLLK